MGFFDNIRYAFTGKQRDRTPDFLNLARDVVFPAVLTPRDKYEHKDADFFSKCNQVHARLYAL